MGDIPPFLQGPTAKERRYDRQLRLWGANGQEALENAHVLLINGGSGVVGIETLKNIILPGIGQYTILDDATVTEADLGVNFFLDRESLGQSRAKRCCELLQDLNPDVRGHWQAANITSFVDETVESASRFLRPYSVIIVTAPVDSASVRSITKAARRERKAVFYVNSIGFYSAFSVFLPHSWPVVDTHPEAEAAIDLRLLNPWPELEEFVDLKTRYLETLDDHEHGHVPYVLLLLHYLGRWKHEHGHYPSNYREKSQFKEYVKKGIRTSNAEGGEENYDEAIAAVLKSVVPYSLSSSTREVFDAPEIALTGDSPSFWKVANAVLRFYETSGVLPLPGSLPDMKAQSADYIHLQNIYKSKARRDCAEVIASVRTFEAGIPDLEFPVSERDVEAFCKGAASVKLIRGARYGDFDSIKHGFETGKASCVVRAIEDPDSLMAIKIAFLIWDAVHTKYQPTIWRDGEKEGSAQKTLDLADQVSKILESKGDGDSAVGSKIRDAVSELIRAKGGELHNISSFTGGMVAQEVIKVITRQYISINDTCVFDGIRSKTASIMLYQHDDEDDGKVRI